MEAAGTARRGLCSPLSPSPWRSSGGKAACKCSSCSQSSWKGSGSCTVQPQPSSLAQHSHSPAQNAASKGLNTGMAHFPTLVAMEPGWVPSPGGRDPSKHAFPMPPQQSKCPRSASMDSAAPRPRDPEETDLWIQLTWPRACPHCFLLWSPLPLPPPQYPFLTLPVQCSTHTPSPAGCPPASRSQGPSRPISCMMHALGEGLRAPPLQVGTSTCQGQGVAVGETLGVCWGPHRTDHCPMWGPPGPHPPRSWMASSNLFSSMAFCTSLVLKQTRSTG